MAGEATAKWLARDAEVLAPVLPRYYDMVAVRGEGSWLYDVDERRYLDLGAGIAVNSTGHCHPHVVEAIVEQARTLLHTSVVVHQQRNIELAERMAQLCDFIEEPQVFLANSGAEVVDGAVKLARRATGRAGLVAFGRAFHGRTLAAVSLTTAKASYREGIGPLLPGVHVAPYCLPHQHAADEDAVDAALAGLDDLLALEASPATIAALIVEPVLGEGGYVPPPRHWLQGLRARCDRHGMLLIFDEVQTGAGRTGRPFAAQTYDVAPDVVLFAKGIASGMPLAGIVAGRKLMERWPTGAHGSTFGGNPVACAAALATLDVLDQEDCYEAAQSLGRFALRYLRGELDGVGSVTDVRGLGLMLGIELTDEATCRQVRQRCFEDGVLVLSCGPDNNVVRVAPPLTISEAELRSGLETLVKVVRGL